MSGFTVERGTWLVEGHEDWSEWFQRGFNWLNFTFIRLEYEHNRMMGTVDVCAGLLGLNLRVAYLYEPDTPMRRIIERRRDELLASFDRADAETKSPDGQP